MVDFYGASRHQNHTFDVSVCSRSGIISSVGLDGRLHQSLGGRLHPNLEALDADFAYGRAILHLQRYRDPAADEINSNGAASTSAYEDPPPPVLRKHVECRDQSWLEARVGDAALLDYITVHFLVFLLMSFQLSLTDEETTLSSA